MSAAVLDGGKIALRRVDVPERPLQFALLELLLGGICNTDLELQRGYYNFSGIPGHEFVARVIKTENPELLGKRVVGEINLACGVCDFCSQGLARHCRSRTVLGIVKHPGAFAQFLTLPERNLHIVPESIPDRQAVFVEPLAAACEILDQIQLPAMTQVAVLGDGKLGLLISQVLLAHGLNVHLYGRHENKLEIARKCGARVSLSTDVPRAAYACVVECTGSSQGLSTAVEMTRPRGTVVLKSTIHDPITIDLSRVIVNEISFVGSRCGRFEPALDLLARQDLYLDEMISAEFPLSEVSRAFEVAARKGTLKVLLRN